MSTENVWIEAIGRNVYRIRIAGDADSQIVNLGGFDSPHCDGQEEENGCRSWCKHIEAVDAAADYDDSDEPMPEQWTKIKEAI